VPVLEPSIHGDRIVLAVDLYKDFFSLTCYGAYGLLLQSDIDVNYLDANGEMAEAHHGHD